jgi:hypothetical protein
MICPYLKSRQMLQKGIFQSLFVPRNGIPSYFLFRGMVRNGIQKIAPIFVTRNEIPSIFLFRGMVRNKILRVCFYFHSTVENSEHFSLPRNGSERNSESFLFRGTAGIPPEQTNCSGYSVFRGIFFLSEIANPSLPWIRFNTSSALEAHPGAVEAHIGE